ESGVGLVRSTGWDARGTRVWATRLVIIYRDPDTRQLLRKEVPASRDLPLVPDRPAKFAPELVARVAGRRDLPARALLGRVKSFRIQAGGTPEARSNPVRIRLEVEYPGQRGIPATVLDERTVTLQGGV
ncbi:MAG: hypothetical protein AB1758_18510, partial [Candidatus Eremiobacterota bacterium]